VLGLEVEGVALLEPNKLATLKIGPLLFAMDEVLKAFL